MWPSAGATLFHTDRQAKQLRGLPLDMWVYSLPPCSKYISASSSLWGRLFAAQAWTFCILLAFVCSLFQCSCQKNKAALGQVEVLSALVKKPAHSPGFTSETVLNECTAKIKHSCKTGSSHAGRLEGSCMSYSWGWRVAMRCNQISKTFFFVH